MSAEGKRMSNITYIPEPDTELTFGEFKTLSGGDRITGYQRALYTNRQPAGPEEVKCGRELIDKALSILPQGTSVYAQRHGIMTRVSTIKYIPEPEVELPEPELKEFTDSCGRICLSDSLMGTYAPGNKIFTDDTARSITRSCVDTDTTMEEVD